MNTKVIKLIKTALIIATVVSVCASYSSFFSIDTRYYNEGTEPKAKDDGIPSRWYTYGNENPDMILPRPDMYFYSYIDDTTDMGMNFKESLESHDGTATRKVTSAGYYVIEGSKDDTVRYGFDNSGQGREDVDTSAGKYTGFYASIDDFDNFNTYTPGQLIHAVKETDSDTFCAFSTRKDYIPSDMNTPGFGNPGTADSAFWFEYANEIVSISNAEDIHLSQKNKSATLKYDKVPSNNKPEYYAQYSKYLCGEEKPVPVTDRNIKWSWAQSTDSYGNSLSGYFSIFGNSVSMKKDSNGKYYDQLTKHDSKLILNGQADYKYPNNYEDNGTGKYGPVAVNVYIDDGSEPVVTEIPATAIKLDMDSAELEVGGNDSVQLGYTLTPANSTDYVTWITSDPKIAEVEEGLVTARGGGRATITAKTKSGKTAKCIVNVTSQLPEEIRLNFNTIEHVNVGDTLQLEAVVYPVRAKDRTVTWSSSDDAVAKVSQDGLVTFFNKSDSGVIITACTANGKSETCTIKKVHGEDDPDTSERIDVNASSIVIEVGEKKRLIATWKNAKSMDSMQWEVTDGKKFVSVGNNGMVTGKKEGTAKVRVHGKNKANKNLSATVTVTVRNSAPVENKAANESLKSSIKSRTLKLGDSKQGSAEIIVTTGKNIQGKPVSMTIEGDSISANKLGEDQSKGTTRYSVTARKPGVAYIKWSCGSSVAVSKFVVIKEAKTCAAIRINEDDQHVKHLEGFPFTATIEGGFTSNDAITWKVSGTNDVKVGRNGYVYVKGYPFNKKEPVYTATITAKVGSGASAIESKPVTVTIEKGGAKNMTMNRNEFAMKNGTSKTIIAKVNPIEAADDIVWTCDEGLTVQKVYETNGVYKGKCSVTAPPGIPVGRYTVTATIGSMNASCAMEVR